MAKQKPKRNSPKAPEKTPDAELLPKVAEPPSAQPLTTISADRPLDVSTNEFKKQLKLRDENRKILIDWIRSNLKAGIDYMRVWSRKRNKWSKPFLLKPGAEKICGMLGVTPTFPNMKEYEQRFREQLHVESIVIQCYLVNGQGRIVSEGVGARLLNHQDEGDVNKSLKMALKSSQNDAILRYGGLSEIFTQEPDSETDEVAEIITEAQHQELIDLIKKSPLKEEKVAEYFAVSNIKLLPAELFFRAKKAILKKINEKNSPKDEKKVEDLS